MFPLKGTLLRYRASCIIFIKLEYHIVYEK